MVRWSLVVVSPGRTWPVELPVGRPAVVGRGPGVAVNAGHPSVSERHLSLAPRDDGLLLEVLRGAGEVWVNDVPVSRPVVVRPGDEVRLGDVRLVPLAVPPVAEPRHRLATHHEVVTQLEAELRRAARARPVAIALVSAPGLNVAARQALTRRVVDDVAKAGIVATWGEVAGDLLLSVLPEVGASQLAEVAGRLPDVAGPRARVVMARSPQDGLDAEALVGVAWARLFDAEAAAPEPTWTDPVMIRLAALMETDAVVTGRGAVCAVGPGGAGRRTLLGVLARAAGRDLREVSAADEAGLEAALAQRRDDWLLVRELDCLSPEAVAQVLARAGARVLATARRAPPAGLFEVVVEVPPLHARPQDLVSLADALVARARRLLGRPRLTLGAEARALLGAWPWPGNVRELENALLRAARCSVRDEVGQDSLPERLSAGAPAEDYRQALKAAERGVLLDALARTRWNVTAAAARLGMPRRTVVHRMARLGLKRPSR
jgi:hypothetical protein